MPKIKYVLFYTSSERDVNGNTYHFVILIDTQTGKKVVSTVDTTNPLSIMGEFGLVYGDFSYFERTLPLRRFREYTKGVSHLLPCEFVEAMKRANDET